jgi:RecA-family ATPase
MTFGRDGRGQLTGFYDQLRQLAGDERADFIVTDTVADTFGGNQNDAWQVRQFVQFCLGGLARAIGGGVLACAHPSRSGMNSNDGSSGSVQWDAAFRSRLYLAAPKREGDDEPIDPDARVLTRKKANYASKDESIDLYWQNGVLKTQPAPVGEAPDAQTVALVEIERMWSEGQPVSNNTHAGNYAPRVLARRGGRHGYRKADFERAIQRLFERREIEIVEYRTPDRKTHQRIARSAPPPFREAF